MSTGPFGVEVVSKVNPFKAKAQVKSQLKLVKQTKGTGLAPSGRGGPKRISYKNTLLNVAGTRARVKSRNGSI